MLGLGTDIGPMGICYRTDLLQQAGLPTDPAQLSAQMPDWDGFLALGEKFQAAAPAGTAWHDSAGGLYNAIISTQQQIYYDASGKLVYASNPAVRQAFDTAAKAGQAGLTAKLEQFVDPGWDQGFASGRFATIACPSWMIGYIKGKAGDAGAGKWNVTSLPGGAGGNWGGSYLGIPASSQHKEEAAKLITWLTAPEQQAKVFAQVGQLPVDHRRRSTEVAGATDPYFNGAPIGKIFSDLGDGGARADPRPAGRRREERDDPGPARRRDRRRHAGRRVGRRPARRSTTRSADDRRRPGWPHRSETSRPPGSPAPRRPGPHRRRSWRSRLHRCGGAHRPVRLRRPVLPGLRWRSGCSRWSTRPGSACTATGSAPG